MALFIRLFRIFLFYIIRDSKSVTDRRCFGSLHSPVSNVVFLNWEFKNKNANVGFTTFLSFCIVQRSRNIKLNIKINIKYNVYNIHKIQKYAVKFSKFIKIYSPFSNLAVSAEQYDDDSRHFHF